MTTSETLNENNDSLYEGLDLPSEGFSFGVDVPDGDPDKDVESNDRKIKIIKEIINNSSATEDEKEMLISLIDGMIDNKDAFNSLYLIISKYKEKDLLKTSEDVSKLTKEVVDETSKYLLSEPKKIGKFIEKLHLPLDKKDILVSIILSTILPTLGIPLPVDPITVNTLYNSGTILNEMDKKVKADTNFARNMAAKITSKIIELVF